MTCILVFGGYLAAAFVHLLKSKSRLDLFESILFHLLASIAVIVLTLLVTSSLAMATAEVKEEVKTSNTLQLIPGTDAYVLKIEEDLYFYTNGKLTRSKLKNTRIETSSRNEVEVIVEKRTTSKLWLPTPIDFDGVPKYELRTNKLREYYIYDKSL